MIERGEGLGITAWHLGDMREKKQKGRNCGVLLSTVKERSESGTGSHW